MATRAIGDTATVQDLDARLTAVELNKADITALAPYAPLASPTFTGSPLAPTAAAGTSTTQLATTAFVTSGIAAAGASLLVSPAFTGTPTAPTASTATSNTQIATTAFVSAKINALINGADAAHDTFIELQNLLAADESTAAALAVTVGGKLTKSANLSDLTDFAAARTNLSLVPGTHVMAYSANLATFATRAIGVASSTDIPDRASADARYALAGATSGGGLTRSAVAAISRTQALNAVREQAAATSGTTTATTVYGSVAYDATDATSGSAFANIDTHAAGTLTQVRLRLSAAGTGKIDIVRPSTGAILQSFDVTASGAGVVTVSAFSGYALPADAVVAYRALTGGVLRYLGSAGIGSIYYYTNSDATDGSVTLSTAANTLVSIEYTVTTTASTGTAGTPIVYGSIVNDGSDGTSTDSYGQILTHGGGTLTEVRLRMSAAGTGKIDIVRPSTGAILQSFDVTASGAGVVAITNFGGYKIPSDAVVAYRRITGGVLRYLSAAGAGDIYHYTSTDASDNLVTLATATNTGLAIEYTVTVPSSGALYPSALLDSSWNGMITYGQSLSDGTSPYNTTPPPLSTSQPYGNLTFGSGVRSSKPGNTRGAINTSPGTTTVIPLVESNTPLAEGATGAANYNGSETLCSGAANLAVTLAATQQGVLPANFVIFASTAGHGGWTISQLGKTGTWYGQLTDHVSEMVARAATAGKAAKLIAVPWMQGESDAAAGTSRTIYLAAFQQLADYIIADAKAITGQDDDPHILTYQTATPTSGTLAQLNAIQLAQLDAANQHSRIHLVSPIYHLMGGSTDSVHMGPIGELWYGRYNGRAFYQLSVERREPDRIRILSATAKGTALKIRFDVPTAPLVMDNFIAVATNNGFKVVDDTGTLTLSSIAVGSDGTSVTMTLSRSLGTNPKVRYALDFLGSGLPITNGASGNLRDSTPDSFVSGSTTYPLYHVCPHFEQAIVVLENA